MIVERKPLGDMSPAELRQVAVAEYRAVYGRVPRWAERQQRRVS